MAFTCAGCRYIIKKPGSTAKCFVLGANKIHLFNQIPHCFDL